MRRTADAPLARAANEVDDAERADDRQDESAGTAEQQLADDSGDERGADADEDGLADAHGIAAREGQAAERADDQSGDDQSDDEADQGVSPFVVGRPRALRGGTRFPGGLYDLCRQFRNRFDDPRRAIREALGLVAARDAGQDEDRLEP